jgi:hypothetical protein
VHESDAGRAASDANQIQSDRLTHGMSAALWGRSSSKARSDVMGRSGSDTLSIVAGSIVAGSIVARASERCNGAAQRRSAIAAPKSAIGWRREKAAHPVPAGHAAEGAACDAHWTPMTSHWWPLSVALSVAVGVDRTDLAAVSAVHRTRVPGRPPPPLRPASV